MNSLKYLKWYFITMALLFVLLVIIGIVKGYSPVPHWDMWDGYLGSYVKTADGDYWQWIAQHNEHRIFFSRILFWIDIEYFGGKSLFLLPVNFLLLSIFVYLLTHIAKQLDLIKSYGKNRHSIIIALLVIFCFSWMQSNNLDWGFQSQFLAAYLFPFSAFYLIYRYSLSDKTSWLISALFMGIFSAGTMANGVLALPILFVLAILLKLKFRDLLIIAVLAILVNFLYFYNFQSNSGHGSLSQTLIEHPLQFIMYIFTYLGNPFYYILFRQDLGAQLFGFMFVLTVFFSFFYALIKIENSPLKKLLLVLFAYILYVGGTAFGTAGGRAVFGLHQAIESRYTTPTLFAWSSLILVLFFLFQHKLKFNNQFFYGLALIPLLLLGVQVEALKNRSGEFFDRQVAALALEMGVRDESYIKPIFPFIDWLEEIVVEPKDRNLSIFGSPMIIDVEKAMGNTLVNFIEDGSLVGNLDGQNIIDEDREFIRVTGWVYNTKQNKPSSPLWIVNHQNKIVGYALVGYPREDVSISLGMEKAKLSGFKGYLKTGESGQLHFVDRDSKESISFRLEDIALFPIIKNWQDLILKKNQIVKLADIDALQTFTWQENATYEKHSINGFKVFGSFINGDAYQGQITLKVNKGALLIYKTGPKTEGQILTISSLEGKVLLKWVLPMNREWVGLKLGNKMLPKEFKLTISDNGNGWGQWSSILLAE